VVADVVRRYVAILNESDFDALPEVLSPHLAVHTAAGTIDLPSFLAAVRRERAAFSGFHAQIEDVIAAGNRASFRLWSTATHTGQLGPHAPTGRSFAVRVIHQARVEHGRIRELWLVDDVASVLRQLGLG
jgi:predicted ester cyclase